MSPSQKYPLSLVIAAAFTIVSCSDSDSEQCGIPSDTGTAAFAGLSVSVDDISISYGNFLSSPNNDCPTDGSPTSLTVTATQTTPDVDTTYFFTICLPRPELLNGNGATLSLANETEAILVDVNGESDGCTYKRDAGPATGTITSSGFCDNGTHPDGYLLSISGTVPGIETCGVGDEAIETSVTIDLSGAILPRPSA